MPPAVTPERVTITDVAQAAGLSVGTVSRILNGGNKDVWKSSIQRSDRVKRLAKQMGYVPNHSARRLAAGKSMAVGLIYAQAAIFPDGLYPALASVASEQLAKADYDLMLIPAIGRFEDWSRKLADQRVDGCLVMQPMPLGLDDMIRQTAMPTVLVNLTSDLPVPHILFDDAAGMGQVVDHLRARGHRRIAFFRDVTEELAERRREPEPHYSIAERERAFVQSGEPDTRPVFHETPANFARRLADMPPQTRPTAIVAYKDREAITLMLELRRVGLYVPGDIAVAGFDDSEFSRYAMPPLTSIRLGIEAMARLAIDELMAQIEAGERTGGQKMLRVRESIVIRESTLPKAETANP